MPISRGNVTIAADGAETKSGLSKRLYDTMSTSVSGEFPGGTLPSGPDGVLVRDAMAATARIWAEWVTPPVHDKGSVSGDVTIDFLDGWAQKLSLGGATTVSFANLQDGASIVLHIINTAGTTLTWPAEAKFRSGSSDATITAAAGRRDLYMGHVEGGSVWFDAPAKDLS